MFFSLSTNMEMIMSKRPSPCHISPLLVLLASAALLQTATSIGVNYGTVANNLPNPAQVAEFIKSKTIIDRVKIFDMNPDIIKAFANTGILLSISVPNNLIIELSDSMAARKWVLANIKPFYPQTKINHLLVGNEVLHFGSEPEKQHLVGAMRALHHALTEEGMGDIKVTTPHSLAIIRQSEPPSQAHFTPGWDQAFLRPMLAFHRMTKTPFMVNPYPYFAYSPQNSNFILWRKNPGVFDRATGKMYENMYDLLLDAVFTSMNKMGFGDVEIAVGEVGWPSLGDPGMMQTTVENAKWHNWNVIRKSESGVGTPLMPGRKFETFIFALFNENQKPGSAAERNFGLFRPDFSPVYNVGIMRGEPPAYPDAPKLVPYPAAPKPVPHPAHPAPKPVPHPAHPALKPVPHPAHPARKPVPHPRAGPRRGAGRRVPRPMTGKQWCVPKAGANDGQLQAAINYACNNGLDCHPVQAGGACFNPNNVRAHATYVMNAWYQLKGHQNFNCDFSGSAMITHIDPSTRSCRYNA